MVVVMVVRKLVLIRPPPGLLVTDYVDVIFYTRLKKPPHLSSVGIPL